MVRRPDTPIPTSPGVYLFRDAEGRVLYVGKAKSLRSRLANYFSPSYLATNRRIAHMTRDADSVEWIVVDTEVEAFLLEYSLIKQHRPRFNIRLRDDKSYPYLAITTNQEWPRPMVVRGRKRRGVRYFGPYAHAWAIRETLDLLLRTFPVRTCSDGKFRQHERLGRPCLYFHIERCCGPCVGKVDHDTYTGLVDDLIGFLEGDHAPVLDRLQAEMLAASDELEFERAARLRDQLGSVRRASEKQAAVLERRDDVDAVGIHGDELEWAVQLFHVRGGRICGRRGFIVENIEDQRPDDLLRDVLVEFYADADDIPAAIAVPWMPSDPEPLAELLTRRRSELAADTAPGGTHAPSALPTRDRPTAMTTGDPGTANHQRRRSRGGRVGVAVPNRGDRKDLLDVATANAKEAFVAHRLRRSADLSSRGRALEELADALGLPNAPLRIECFDISQVQGTNPVASMVTFEDALPRKDEYRRFAIRTVDQQDDFAMMREALTRRFTNYKAERDTERAERLAAAGDATVLDEAAKGRRKFAYAPGLLLIDGGRGQLNVALDVLEELGLADEIPAAGLAKRFEEVYLPGEAEPVRLPRGSEALYLLQRVRDEAHRFAITYHRQRRGAAMTKSVLDDVAGLGPARRRKLLDAFGSVDRMRSVGLDELRAVPGVPVAVADAVWHLLHPGETTPEPPPHPLEEPPA